jgi:predicted alpha/beta hydrolase
MKIALIGSRGIPARYSGFEQFYEQFAVRLAARGYEVLACMDHFRSYK